VTFFLLPVAYAQLESWQARRLERALTIAEQRA